MLKEYDRWKRKVYVFQWKKENNLTFENNSHVIIKGKEIVLLKKKVKARNVLFVDGLRHNLLSAIKICDQGHELIFK